MICVFDKGSTMYEGNGDAVLVPLTCTHRQVAGGKYDLSLTHPIDKWGKWEHLVPEAIIKAPVQEETIESAVSGLEADLYRTNTTAALRSGTSEPTAITYQTWDPYSHTYAVGDKVSVAGGYSHRNYQCVQWIAGDPQSIIPPYASNWWKPIADTTSGSPVLISLKPDTDLYYLESAGSGWAKVTTVYGLEGYIKTSQITYIRHLTPSETQPRTIDTQLFRIKNVSIDTKEMTVSVSAEHVSQDLAGIMIDSAKVTRQPAAMALAWIEQSFMSNYAGTIATNMTTAADGVYSGEIKGKNALYAILDPDRGVVGSLGAMYRRDNWDLFVMKKVQTDRGFRLRYGKNVFGITWTRKSDSLVTRVVPVAKAADGSELYLDGTRWVESSLASQYPVVRTEWLKVNGQVGKDDGTETATNWTETTLRAEMARQAQARFDTDKVDQIVEEVTVDFAMLGASEEYSELRDLERALMYDTVVVIDERVGLSVQVEVSEIEYDAIRRKVTGLKMTNVVTQGRSVTGYNINNNSVGTEKLTADATDGIISEATDSAAAYSDSRLSSEVSSLRSWVNSNFQRSTTSIGGEGS